MKPFIIFLFLFAFISWSASAQNYATTGNTTVSQAGTLCSAPTITNQQNFSDADYTNYMQITIPVSASCTYTVSAELNGTAPAGYYAGIYLGGSSLSSLLGTLTLTIVTYYRGVQQESQSRFSQSLNGNAGNIYFQTTKQFDSIALQISGLSMASALDLYYGFASSNVPGTASVLPVELTNFSGNLENDGSIQLNWGTAQEFNNNYFAVERSDERKIFDSLGTIKGFGNSSVSHSYIFTDTNPASGMNYYRLQQVNFDGSAFYSKVIGINNTSSSRFNVQVFPNPARYSIEVKAENARSGNYRVDLISLDGKNIFIGQWEVPGDDFSRNILLNSGINAGIYILKLVNTTTGTVYSQKIILTR
jgi:Secretion system C-terminal sorting domain